MALPAALSIAVGCSEDDDGGTSNSGGALGSGGATGGSAPANGGRAAGSGGMTGSGAVTAAGGTNSGSGGSPVSGGSKSTAGSGGMKSGTGGRSSTSGGTNSGGASGGSKSTGGSGGMSPPNLDQCPDPPSGVTPETIEALNAENSVRLAMGLECAELVPELNLAAQNHCDYYAQNSGDDECEAPSPHSEIEGCPGYTGSSLGQRYKAAGYQIQQGAFECMAFLQDPARSVQAFIDTVYHRTPVLDPWMRHMGYGGAEDCDTIDFATGPSTPDDVTAFYPYANQTNVPTSFNGAQEGPEPPEPSTGWPSGYPVTLYGQDLEVTSHTITVDGSDESLPHVWLAENDDTLPSYAKVLYTEAPLEPNTTYRVVIDATRGSEELHFEWTFTTGMGRMRPF